MVVFISGIYAGYIFFCLSSMFGLFLGFSFLFLCLSCLFGYKP